MISSTTTLAGFKAQLLQPPTLLQREGRAADCAPQPEPCARDSSVSPFEWEQWITAERLASPSPPPISGTARGPSPKPSGSSTKQGTRKHPAARNKIIKAKSAKGLHDALLIMRTELEPGDKLSKAKKEKNKEACNQVAEPIAKSPDSNFRGERTLLEFSPSIREKPVALSQIETLLDDASVPLRMPLTMVFRFLNNNVVPYFSMLKVLELFSLVPIPQHQLLMESLVTFAQTPSSYAMNELTSPRFVQGMHSPTDPLACIAMVLRLALVTKQSFCVEEAAKHGARIVTLYAEWLIRVWAKTTDQDPTSEKVRQETFIAYEKELETCKRHIIKTIAESVAQRQSPNMRLLPILALITEKLRRLR